LNQLVHLSSRSTTTTVIPRQSLASQSDGGSSHGTEVGRPHLESWPLLPTNMLGETDTRYRPTTASGAVIRGIQRERRWITGPAAPPDPDAPVILGPRAQPTYLTYQRHFTLARLDTQRWSIFISLFCSLRVGLV
jgi:hypothetical protein